MLKRLSRAGLIASQRGVGGGVKLAQPARQITLLQLISAVDPPMRKVSGTSPLNRKVDAIVGQMQKSFAATTLADVEK